MDTFCILLAYPWYLEKKKYLLGIRRIYEHYDIDLAYCPVSVNLSPGRHFLTVSFSSKLISASTSTGELVFCVAGDVAFLD
jgi:hypothetical protein